MLDHIMHVDHFAATNIQHNCSAPRGQRGSCGCVNNTMGYNYILELSVRLRKAVEALSRLADHRPGGADCELFRRIAELDRLAT